MCAIPLGILTIEPPSERKNSRNMVSPQPNSKRKKTLKRNVKCNEFIFKEFLDIFARYWLLRNGQKKINFVIMIAYRHCNHCPINKQLNCHVSCLRINVRPKFMPVMMIMGCSLVP